MENLRIYIDKIRRICVDKKTILSSVILILILIILLLIIGLYALIGNNDDNINLYKVYSNGQYIFINENGDEILKIPENKYDYVGEFREGRLFVADNIIDNIGHDRCWCAIVKLYILDKNGKIIKEIKQSNKVIFSYEEDGETSLSYLPEFYKGYAIIHFAENKNINSNISYDKLKINDVYINKNGYIVRKPIKPNIKKMLNDKSLSYSRFEPDKDVVFKVYEKQNKYGYVDKNGNIVIKPIFDYASLCCGDFYTRNPQFYDGIAVVNIYDNKFYKDGTYYINKKGEILNKEPYVYAAPYYGDLAYVETTTQKGYINRQGNFVWSETITEDSNEDNFVDGNEITVISKEEQEKIQELENEEKWDMVKEHVYVNPESIKDIEWIGTKWRQGEFKFYKTLNKDNNFSFSYIKNSVYVIYTVLIANDGTITYLSEEYFDINNKYITGNYNRGYATNTKYTDTKLGFLFYKTLFK